jgi:chemotaxis signal transduction protein
MQVLLLKIADNKYCIDINNIEEIISRKDTVPVNKKSKIDEGIMTYRDNVIHLFNLRKILGYTGFEEETLQLIKQVEQGHLDWVENFQDSLFNGTPFLKTFDPHACVLGKWIDKTVACLKCNNQGFVNLIKDNLIQSHNKLHNRGQWILNRDSMDEKTHYFEKETKVCLKECIEGLHLLEKEVHKLVYAFERIIVYKDENIDKMIGLTIDDVERMIEINDEDIKDTSSNFDEKGLIKSTKAYISKKSEIIPILELNMKEFSTHM